MKSLFLTLALCGLGVPGAVFAQDSVLRMNDVTINYQPKPASYQPDGTNYDLADQGKSFNIACVIGADGHPGGCRADNNNMVDQNFVSRALGNVSQWVIDPTARDGSATTGQTLVITCQFTRTDEAPQRIASVLAPR